MKRGTFIKNSLYLIAAGGVLSNLPFNLFKTYNSQKHDLERLFSKLDNGFILKKYAEELGNEYISMQEKGLSLMFTKFEFNSANSLQKIIERQGGSVHKVLQKMIRQDFENCNTIRLKGWILSETEAKLSALYKMTT